MPSLTVLDYTALDVQQKNIQAELHVKDKQIQMLTKRMSEMEEFWSRSYDELKTLVQDGGVALRKAIEEDEVIS